MTALIAEVGSSHGWSHPRAMRLIESCAEAGADLVKFQCHRGNPLKPDAPDFKDSEWVRLAAHCAAHEVEFLCSPFSLGAATMLDPLVERWKIASGQVTNHDLIHWCALTNKQILISDGLATHHEMMRALDEIVVSSRHHTPYRIMNCLSMYPTPPEYWVRPSEGWTGDTPFGWSDHSGTIELPLAAAARGCPYVEVHVKDDGPSGPDAASSLSLDQFTALAEGVSLWNQAKGKPLPPDHLHAMRAKYLFR